jgi:hypothetical protein
MTGAPGHLKVERLSVDSRSARDAGHGGVPLPLCLRSTTLPSKSRLANSWP